jgi:hypothetical protein
VPVREMSEEKERAEAPDFIPGSRHVISEGVLLSILYIQNHTPKSAQVLKCSR